MRATPAPHNYAYQIMHPPPSWEDRNYLDSELSLQPRTTTQLQGNELRPRTIDYADDTAVIQVSPTALPVLSAILRRTISPCHVFLFVSVHPEAEMASHDETATQNQPAG